MSDELWFTLSPKEFSQLLHCTECNTRKLKDVLKVFYENKPEENYDLTLAIDYEVFKKFIGTYLMNISEDLCKHLFLSFRRKTQTKEQVLKETSGISSSKPAIAKSQEIPDTVSKEEESSILPTKSKSQETSMEISLDKAEFESLKPAESKVNALSHSSLVSKPKDVVYMSDVICYLTLLERGQTQDKLEFMFRLYDSDGKGYLDDRELDQILNQMLGVAEYLEWDCTELKPILKEMIESIDLDHDGIVTLEEWIHGGMNIIPLLVLLGMETNVNEDGQHSWMMKKLKRPTYCHVCHRMLVRLRRPNMRCSYCKYTIHQRCAPKNIFPCITTYARSRKQTEIMQHVWIEGNQSNYCDLCNKRIKCYPPGGSVHCVWCQITLHKKCSNFIKRDCDGGEFRDHLILPSSIIPIVLDRKSESTSTLDSSLEDSITEIRMTPSAQGENQLKEKKKEITSTKIPSAGSSPDNGIKLIFSSKDTKELKVKEEEIINITSFHAKVSLIETDKFKSSLMDGYGLKIIPQKGTHPLLVLLNPKSGGKQGERLSRKFQYLLNPRQVYNLAKLGPVPGLNFFRYVPNFRVLICGGDGTIGWVLDCIDKIHMPYHPRVAILPLGTGNDLSRCLRWGKGYNGGNLKKLFKHIEMSSEVMLDRWQLEIIPKESGSLEDFSPTGCVFNNYFSIGVDASIAHRFHLKREKYPHKFNSRMKNRLWYFEFGTTEIFASTCKRLHSFIEVECDGIKLDLKGMLLQGIAIINIPSIYGGTNLWGEDKHQAKFSLIGHKSAERFKTVTDPEELKHCIQDYGDRLLEVVGLEGAMEMGKIYAGLKNAGTRLAQCASITIRTTKTLPMQVDGEPWMQEPCTARINHRNQIPMLLGPPPKSNYFFLKRSYTRDL